MWAKERAMADMVMIAAMDGRSALLGYREAEAMYDAVVYHRRWWRRAWNWIGAAGA